jgi:hypothetical protein
MSTMTRSLPALPPTFAETRLALHRLAFYVVSPARRLATGNEIALSATPGGFGTPPGEAWGQVRVDGAEVVVERSGHLRRAPITSLHGAARLAGIAIDPSEAERFDVPPPGPLDAQLPVEADAAAALAGWYALGDQVLRAIGGEVGASPPRLWPEHFDLAIDVGTQSWGFSPGDAGHDDPYLYVSLPAADVPGGDGFWNASHFPGALLPYAALVGADDPHSAALAFLRGARRRLAS